MEQNKPVSESGLTIGSLFDGSGGFPLGGLLSGIQPIWASEIEPFPIRVTTKRLPFIKHYGDVSKMNGGEIEPVGIITFGSPCQDMSVAGKRVGLDGSRSNLFYEAVRIVREMRCATNGQKPRYIVWENVPGAFSSNKGEDFKAVLEAVCKIKDETCDVPKCKKWESAGEILGDNFSVAWRVLDAQYWGVPQRRKRIFLVADFAGGGAGEILFKSEGMPRDSAESRNEGQGAAGNAKNCAGKTGDSITCLNDQGGRVMSVSEDITATLRGEEHGHQPCIMQSSGFCTEHSAKSRSVGYEEERSPTLRAGVVPATVMAFEPGTASRVGGHTDENLSGSLRANMGDNQTAVAIENHPTDSRVKLSEDNKVQTLTSRMGTGGMNVPLVMNERQYALTVGEDVANTLTGTDFKGTQCVFEPKTLIGRQDKNGPQGDGINDNMSFALNTVDRHGVVYAIDRETFNCGQNYARNLGITEDGINSPLKARGPSAIATPTYTNYTVRRLTPTECARLQGFPDDWCDDLGTENPSEDEILFWAEVWETHRKIMGKSSKPKTRKQIIKWLNSPHSDSAEYKMWGNGVALPCVCFVLSGIKIYSQD